LRECRFYQAGRLDRPRRSPSVQSPFAQLGCYLRWGDVIRLLRGHYSSVFARTGSCAAPVGLSLPSAFWPRLESPCRLLPVPAAHGSFPTLSPTVCSWMLDPLPRRYTVCSHLFLPRCHRPSPKEKWVGFPQLSRLKRLRAGGLSRLQIFRYVPASKFARPPDRPYRCEYSRRAAGAFTSEQNAVRYLPAHRIC
jgi:hypothetical protein